MYYYVVLSMLEGSEIRLDKTPFNTESHTAYPKKYAHDFCFAVLCCGYALTDFSISIRLTSLALWQSNDCPSASNATLMNMDRYFMWIHYERLHNQNKAKHIKTVCIYFGIYCTCIGELNHHFANQWWPIVTWTFTTKLLWIFSFGKRRVILATFKCCTSFQRLIKCRLFHIIMILVKATFEIV